MHQRRPTLVAAVIILLSVFAARVGWAHPTALNNRVTFYITAVEQSQIQGEPGLLLRAVLDNGTRNRITLRGLSSDAGDKVTLYAMREIYGLQTLQPRRVLAVRSGEGVELAPPAYTIAITGLTNKARYRKPFSLDLTFNRAISTLTVPVTFLVNSALEHGRGVIDIGPPAALDGADRDVQWMTTDDLLDDATKP